MVSKFYCIVMLAVSYGAQANIINESENFSSSGIHTTAVTQFQDSPAKEISNINEISEQSLKGSSSHTAKRLFRKSSLLMTTQPYEFTAIGEEDDDGNFINEESLDDDAAAGEQDQIGGFEGVSFPNILEADSLFTKQSSYFPTNVSYLSQPN